MEDNGEPASAGANDFGRLAAAIDAAERVAWDRVGGPTEAECAAIRRLESDLPAPSTIAEWRWIAGRLARGLANGWDERAVGRLIELAALGTPRRPC